jgi:hypothetical protein
MPDYRQPVLEYIRACEAVLELGELSEEEAEAVEEMFGRIADKFSTTASREGCGLSRNGCEHVAFVPAVYCQTSPSRTAHKPRFKSGLEAETFSNNPSSRPFRR